MIRSSKQEYTPTREFSRPIEKPMEPAKPLTTSATTTPAPSSPAPQQSIPTAVIGPKIRFKGELAGEEDLLIQGKIDGIIDLKNHNLTIGKNGIIKADVLAKTITIEGSIEGDVYGKEHIVMKASSKVRGNLIADRVTLEDGAKFKGSIDMDISSHKSKFESANAFVSHKASSDNAE